MNYVALRADLRAMLGDPTGGIYSDDQIDAAARIAYHRVRDRHPEPIVITVTTNAGDNSVSLPHAVKSVRAVTAPSTPIEPATAADMTHPRHTAARLTYTADPQQLQLSRQLHQSEAGEWAIRATWIPPLPTTPTADWTLPEALRGAVLNYIAADLLKTRSAQTQRRGSRSDHTHQLMIDTYTREAERITRAYRREARMT